MGRRGACSLPRTTRASDNTLPYQSQPSYDGKGNVTGVTTTLPASSGATGTDVQAFCYDEQDRLTWASSASGAIPCGGTNTAGTLSAASYTQSFAYDNLGRLATGPAGSYTYGDSAHLHAVTSTSGGYTASYDSAGNMTCRAPSSGSTCSGTPTGQQLTFDAEGWLTAWQNTPSAPTSTASYLYDGEGERVAQQVTSGGTTTTTAYIGNIEEVATSGASTTTTTYYYAADIRVALAVNGGAFTYLSDDVLTSQTAAFDASGSPVASVLYGPYGSPRYSNGTMPGSFGFTGQRADSVSGLDYYHARYYDPAAGQFISADSTLGDNGANPWELSRYGYVEGNPETKTDPSGHCPFCVTALIGAAVGAAIGAGTAIAQQRASGHCCDWGKVAGEAAIGAVTGAITGALGPAGGAVATVLTHAIVGATVGAGAQAASNLVEGTPLGDGVITAAVIGGVTGGISGGMIARQAAKAAGPLSCAASCALSFSPDTQVATPSGEQAIGTLQVGDQVTAYDPQTGQTSTQPIVHVWINHDSDLVDVSLRSDTSASQPGAAADDAKVRAAALKAHGLRAPPDDQADIQATGDTAAAQATAELAVQSSHQATQTTQQARDETVHTTAKHLWLTTDRGFVPVAQLQVSERVVREDGTPATIVALQVAHGKRG